MRVAGSCSVGPAWALSAVWGVWMPCDKKAWLCKGAHLFGVVEPAPVAVGQVKLVWSGPSGSLLLLG